MLIVPMHHFAKFSKSWDEARVIPVEGRQEDGQGGGEGDMQAKSWYSSEES